MQSNKLDHIDSLRGIAILMVIGCHVKQSISGLSYAADAISTYGQMGVQLFFMASAYTLCLSTEKRGSEAHRHINFFIRRFFRIAPLYYIGILLYFSYFDLAHFWVPMDAMTPSNYNLQDSIANLFFIHTFHRPSINSVVPGGWSISAEMVFYACFPLLLCLFYYVEGKKGVLSLPLFPVGALVINLLFQIGVTTVTGETIENASFLYFNIINQIPVFLSGILLYFLVERAGFRIYNNMTNAALLSSFTAFSLALWYYQPAYAFVFVPFLSSISFAFLFFIFYKNKALNHPFLKRLGELSYSMYIFHFVFAWHFSYLVAKSIGDKISSDILLIGLYILSVLFTFVIASFSEKIIEKPGIAVGRYLIGKIR